jgi:hypothetical protein
MGSQLWVALWLWVGSWPFIKYSFINYKLLMARSDSTTP